MGLGFVPHRNRDHEIDLDNTKGSEFLFSRNSCQAPLKHAAASVALGAYPSHIFPPSPSRSERTIPVDHFEQRDSRNRRTEPAMAFGRQITNWEMHHVRHQSRANTRSGLDTTRDIQRLARASRRQRGLSHSQRVQRPISAGSRVGGNGSVAPIRRRRVVANNLLWLHVG